MHETSKLRLIKIFQKILNLFILFIFVNVAFSIKVSSYNGTSAGVDSGYSSAVSGGAEIDILVEQNGEIHPLEIKKSASPDRREVKKYELLDKASLNRSYGGIVCCEENPDAAFEEIEKLADKRMYENKAAYYKKTGINRRRQISD